MERLNKLNRILLTKKEMLERKKSDEALCPFCFNRNNQCGYFKTIEEYDFNSIKELWSKLITGNLYISQALKDVKNLLTGKTVTLYTNDKKLNIDLGLNSVIVLKKIDIYEICLEMPIIAKVLEWLGQDPIIEIPFPAVVLQFHDIEQVISDHYERQVLLSTIEEAFKENSYRFYLKLVPVDIIKDNGMFFITNEIHESFTAVELQDLYLKCYFEEQIYYKISLIEEQILNQINEPQLMGYTCSQIQNVKNTILHEISIVIESLDKRLAEWGKLQ